MSELKAGLLVPGVIILFLIAAFFVFRFLTAQARQRRQSLINSAVARHSTQTDLGEHLAAAKEILGLFANFKAGDLSYAEQAPLFLRTGEALYNAKQLRACLTCTVVIEHMLPRQVAAGDISPSDPRFSILGNAEALQSKCGDKMLAGYLKATRLRVQDAWDSSPNTLHKLVTAEIEN